MLDRCPAWAWPAILRATCSSAACSPAGWPTTGRHKLVKYGNGATGLFDLQEDPQEQHNLAESAPHAAEYRHLDAALWRELMRSVQASHAYNVVYSSENVSLWADKAFGAAGWERGYPQPLDQ